MIPPAIVAPIFLASPPSSETGQGSGLSRLLFSNNPSPAQSPPAVQFAELLGAARNKIAQRAQADPDRQATAGNAMAQQPGVAQLASEIDDLVARLLSEPGGQTTPEAVEQFLNILHGAVLANGRDAIEALLENLAELGEEGVVQLELAAHNPATLITLLAELAHIPHFETVVSAGQPYQVISPKPLQRHADLSPLLSKPDGIPAGKNVIFGATVPRPIIQNAGPLDVRALVMGAIVTASTSAERETPPLPVIPSEIRAIPAGMNAALRSAEPAVPQTSGFARNLVQQIRSANISEGNTRIALAPRGLGEIEIDLRPDEAGKLRIVLRAENPAVLQALRGDRDGLLLALSEGGTGVDDAELEFEDFSRKQQQTNEAWESLPALEPDPDADQEPQTAAPPHTGPIGAGAVDILT